MEELTVDVEFESVMADAVLPLDSGQRRVVGADAAHPLPLYFCFKRIAMVRQHHKRVVETGALFLLHTP